MKRDELEHAIRAAADVLGEDTVIIIGSQSIVGVIHEDLLPAAAQASMEVDVLPLDDPDSAKADALQGALGEMSAFDSSFGIWVDGVSEGTATLPAGWRDRLVELRNGNTNGKTGLCLEPHDLCVAKMIAHRPKDREFCEALLATPLLSRRTLVERLAQTEIDDERRQLAADWIENLGNKAGSSQDEGST